MQDLLRAADVVRRESDVTFDIGGAKYRLREPTIWQTVEILRAISSVVSLESMPSAGFHFDLSAIFSNEKYLSVFEKVIEILFWPEKIIHPPILLRDLIEDPEAIIHEAWKLFDFKADDAPDESHDADGKKQDIAKFLSEVAIRCGMDPEDFIKKKTWRQLRLMGEAAFAGQTRIFEIIQGALDGLSGGGSDANTIDLSGGKVPAGIGNIPFVGVRTKGGKRGR